MVTMVKWTGPIYCKLIIAWLQWKHKIRKSQQPHNRLWQHDKPSLARYDQGTLGRVLFTFLTENEFELMKGAETHDLYHVLLNYGTDAVEEVCLQCCLFGSGKRSLYLLAALTVGILEFPEHWSRFRRAYRRGKEMVNFSKWSFEHLLGEPIDLLRSMILKRAAPPTSSINPLTF